MQLTIFDLVPDGPDAPSSGKTSPASSRSQTTPSGASLEPLSATIPHSSRQGAGGQTRVWLLDLKELPRGVSLTLNISDWPNDAAVCSLSQVLETGLIPQKYFLSAKACAGILRRAEKRGKELPTALRSALTSAAAQKATL